MFKKCLSVLLCMTVLLTVLPLGLGIVAFAENEEVAIISGDFVLDASGETILSYRGNEENVLIPNELGIKAIGESAFVHNELIKSVTLPDSLESIGNEAFLSCSNLESITISEGLISIGAYAFWKCVSLKSISIPDSVSEIGDEAFYNCAALTSIDIPKSVTAIGLPAFSYCTALTEINVANENENYSSVDGVLFNKAKTELVQYPAGKSGDAYSIPGTVTSIGGWAFAACTALSSISIPSGLSSINEGAFENCTALTALSLPDSLSSISRYAFSGCTALVSLIIRSELSIEEPIFVSCDKLTIRGYAASFAEEYAKQQGIPFVALSTEPTGLSAADGKEHILTVDEQNKKVFINAKELNLEAFCAIFKEENLCVKDKDGNELDKQDFIIGTGASVIVLDAEGKESGEAYAVIIMGDVNGDGEVKTTDARIALRAAVNIAPLDGLFLDAAIVGGNETLKTSDARKILRVAVKIDNEF